MNRLFKLEFLCDICDTIWNVDDLEIMNNIGANYNTLCCKCCDNDSLKIVVPKDIE